MAKETNRDSFVFYRSFLDIIRMLDPERAKKLTLAIGDYAMQSKEPELDEVLNLLWIAVKPQLDANIRRYENGRKGGAPKGSHNNPYGRQGKPEDQLNEDQTVESESPIQHQVPTTLTAPPSKEEVTSFFKEVNLEYKAETFYNYYQGNGWMTGTSPIVNWKAVARKWVFNEREKNPNAGDPVLGIGEFRDS